MRYKTHLIGGVATGALCTPLAMNVLDVESTGLVTHIVIIAGSMLGSLIPDIDHKGSYLGRRLPVTSTVIGGALGHRGPTHSPLVVSVFSLVLALLTLVLIKDPYSVWIMLFIVGTYFGQLSHILLDALTPQGVPMFYPIQKKKYRIARIRTGGLGESIVAFFLLVLTVIYFYCKLQCI